MHYFIANRIEILDAISVAHMGVEGVFVSNALTVQVQSFGDYCKDVLEASKPDLRFTALQQLTYYRHQIQWNVLFPVAPEIFYWSDWHHHWCT